MQRQLTDRACSSSSDTDLNQAKSNLPKLDSASSVANPQGYDYEVFLSFRGQDTRKGFTNHLYTNLKEAGIRVFLDDEKLEVGEEIGGNLLEATSKSKICIPIFSKNYASSKWCLKEAAHMVKCRNQLVLLPIFYDVTPHEVRHQSGAYEEAFKQHSERYDEETVREWRNALAEIGALKGWELENVANGHEGEIVKIVVSKVWKELKKAHLIVKDSMVGVEDSIEEVMNMLRVGGSDVRIVGIYGIGGIGKTTLAKIIYNQLLENFNYSSFLKDIREMSSQPRGLEKLQTQLVSDILKSENLQHEFPHVDEGIEVLSERFRGKKVLILLDDVDKEDQINALAANLNWFAGGSRIIITTRDKSVLNASQVTGTYEVKPMHFDNALLLFCMHAFKKESPAADYIDLSEKIVATTGGLPLALEVIGSLLYEESRNVWEETFEKLQNGPCEDVQDKLMISYEALHYEEKQIFLDIACFFIGMDRRIASYMWKDWKLYPERSVKVLLQRSLIKVGDDNKFWMHDQLRDLGREIVRKENIHEPGERSRLWSNEDARHVLENEEGTKKIEAIQLDYGIESKDYFFTRKQFSNIWNLRFLRLGKVNVALDSWCFLRTLSWLQWHHCHAEFMETGLYLENLVILDLSRSNITDAWSSWSSRQLGIKLKVLILESCQNLEKTPDLSEFKLLERLSFGDCRSLHKVDPSIMKLKNLIFLSFKNCYRLRELPQELGYLQALVELHIDGSGVQELPTSEGFKKLELFTAKECRSLNHIPSSIGHLTSLLELSLSGIKVCTLPGSIGGLLKLRRLSLRSCRSLSHIPPSIGHLTSLLELSLDETNVCTLPISIGALVKLRGLSLRGCRSLKELPNSIGQLASLKELCLSWAGVHTLPDSIGNLSDLQVLLINFSKISYLPKTLGMLKKLEVIDASGCKSLHGIFAIDLVGLCSLTTLKLGGTNIMLLWVNINGFLRLKTLNLIYCNALQTFSQLPSSLLDLSVTCRTISKFPDLSTCTNLLELKLIRCSIKWIPGLGSLIFLRILKVSECHNLAKLDGLENLESIRELSISCKSLQSLPNLSNLKMLRHLTFGDCEELSKVEGFEELESLECLNMKDCKAIGNLPDLSKLGKLKELVLVKCTELRELQGLQELKSLQRVDISHSFSLYHYAEKWPHIPWDNLPWDDGEIGRKKTVRSEMDWSEVERKGERDQHHRIFGNVDTMDSHKKSLRSRNALEMEWDEMESKEMMLYRNYKPPHWPMDEMESEEMMLSRNYKPPHWLRDTMEWKEPTLSWNDELPHWPMDEMESEEMMLSRNYKPPHWL